MKLALCTPLGNDLKMDIRCASWCGALDRHPQVHWVWTQSIDCDEGRNVMIHNSLKDPDVTHVFFLDSDTVPPAAGVQTLMDLHVPVACGLTPILVDGRHPAWNVRTPDGLGWWPKDRPLPAGPFKTRHMGGTTILVERWVLEQLGYPWFRRMPLDPAKGPASLVSGDVFFSERLGKAGIEIWAHPDVKCNHYKLVDLLALMHNQIVEVHDEAFAGASSVGPAGGPSRPSDHPNRLPDSRNEFAALANEIEQAAAHPDAAALLGRK